MDTIQNTLLESQSSPTHEDDVVVLTRVSADGILDRSDLEEEAHLTVDAVIIHPTVGSSDLDEITGFHA
jgi:hypothetical protein